MPAVKEVLPATGIDPGMFLSYAVDHSHFPRPGENCAVFLFPCGGEDMGSAGLYSFLQSKKRRMDRSPGLGKTVQAWGDENGPAH